MTEPDDRELENYLKGDSKLSQLYREASREDAPANLDETILAQARASVRRKAGGINRYLAPVALAASVVLGVNLAWNVYQAEPVPAGLEKKERSRDEGFVADAPAPAPAPAAAPPAAPAPPPPAALEAPHAKASSAPETRETLAQRRDEPARDQASEVQANEADALRRRAELAESRQADDKRKAEAESSAVQKMQMAQERAPAAAPAAAGAVAPSALADAAPARPAPMPEGAKIDALIRYVAQLEGAVFIRNGTEYGPADAAKHLQYKREKAGNRVKTADDFIRLCASFSSQTGEAYLIKYADGRTRTAEDVLREELARIESGR